MRAHRAVLCVQMKGVGKLLALAALSRTGLAQMGQSDMACESLLTQSSAQMKYAPRIFRLASSAPSVLTRP
eukprot:COSAG04_NODE_27534_length_282_cov_0.836066_1_plen_70_part_10